MFLINKFSLSFDETDRFTQTISKKEVIQTKQR